MWLPGAILLFFNVVGGTNKHAHGFMGVIIGAGLAVPAAALGHAKNLILLSTKYIFSWPRTTTSFVSHFLFTMNVITVHFNTTLDSVLHSLLTMYSILNLDRVVL